MANHGYGHTKQKLTVEQVNNDLLEINKMRFNDLFEITHEGDDSDEIWLIQLREQKDMDFQIWLNRKDGELEWPHGHNGDAGWWFQETFMSLLVSKYDGMISDDGCDGRWNPQFHIKYPHMIDWFMKGMEWIEGGKIKKAFFRKLNQGRYKEELRRLPISIKEVI